VTTGDRGPGRIAIGAVLVAGASAVVASFLPWVRWHLPWLQEQFLQPGDVVPVISSPVEAPGVDHYLGVLALAGGVLVVAGAIGMLLASAARWSRLAVVIGGAAALSAGLTGILDASEVLEGDDEVQATAAEFALDTGVYSASDSENPVEGLVRAGEEATDRFEEIIAGEEHPLASFYRNHPDNNLFLGGVRPLAGPFVAAGAGLMAMGLGLALVRRARGSEPEGPRTASITERPSAPLG